MDPHRDPGASLSGARVGPYLIGERIGAGGMGDVYRASDQRLHRTVAIKALAPQLAADQIARRRLAREARLACSVNHPYIATVYDVVEKDDDLLLAMEYIEGRTLSRVLREDSPDLPTVVRYAREIAEALTAIHRVGVVHRDLKPGNVMITTDGHVKVMDFGLARRQEMTELHSEIPTVSESLTLTGSGRAVGTPMYMSPEQMRGEEVDVRSDLFSFGILLYESITGEHPFQRETPQESMAAILHEPPSAGIDPEILVEFAPLRRLLHRLLEKDPDRRLGDATLLLEELRSAERGFNPIPGPGRHWLGLAIAVVAVLATVAGVRWWMTRPPVWDSPRTTIAVPPFRNQTSLADGALVASMVGELLIADLSGSHLVRIVGAERVVDLATGALEATNRRALVDRVVAGTSADYVLLGTIYNENGTLAAKLDFATGDPDQTQLASVQTSAASALALVEQLGSRTRRNLPEVSRLTAIRDERGGVEEVAAGSPEARRHFQRGLQANRMGDLIEAIEQFQAAVAADPEFALGFAHLATTLHNAGYGRRAREAADRAVQLSPEPQDRTTQRVHLIIRATRALAYERDDDRTEATGRLAATFPDEPALLANHAVALDTAGEQEAAAALLDRAFEIAPDDPWLMLNRAVLLMRAAQEESLEWSERAEEAFRRLESPYWIADAVYTRGRGLSALRKMPEAISELERALDEVQSDHPLQEAKIRLEIGRIETLQGRSTAARERILEAGAILRAAGDLGTLCHALSVNGGRLFVQGRYEEAEADLRESVDLARQLENDSRLLSPLANLAGLLTHRGFLEEARERYGEVLPVAERLGRENTEVLALLYLADIEYQLGDPEKGLAGYARLQNLESERDLTHLVVWSYLGVAEIERVRGHPQESLAQADRAVEIARERSMADVLGYGLAHRGYAAAETGDEDAAIRDIDEARKIADEAGRGLGELVARAELVRAVALLRGGRFDEALRQADRALAVGASGVPALAVVGERLACEALLRVRRLTEAISRCRASAEIERAPLPEKVESSAWSSWLLAEAGNEDQARTLAERVFEQASEMGLRLSIARSAAVWVRVAEKSAATERIRRAGLQALQAYIDEAPADRRPRVRERPDVAELESVLRDRPDV